MDQSIIELYDEYTHAPLPRREFMKRLTQLVGTTAAAAALLPLLENNYAQAQMVAPTDARIAVERTSYPGAQGSMKAYLARPKGGGKHPAMVVIHENRGLNPHIEDITRRLAVDGFLAMAPDGLSPVGGTPADQDKARTLIRELDRAKTLQSYLAAVTHLHNHPESTGKVGCVGFCWGGGLSNQLAVNSAELSAAVVFYGRSPSDADVPKIKAALLLHYAGLDKRINASVPTYENALKSAGISYTRHTYEGANHAFNNDTNAARYNPAAAKLAWSRTVAFLKGALG